MELPFYIRFLILISLVGGIRACNKYEYNYQVVDCREPQIQALGDYIMQQIQRKERVFRSVTCFDENMKFLQAAPLRSIHTDFDAKKIAAAWVYKYFQTPSQIFFGPAATIEAIREGRTLNVIVDKELSIHRYILRNTIDGSVSVAYLSEEDLMVKVSNEQFWDKQDVLECENFIFFLSKEFPNQLVSFTVADKNNSNDELRFITKSSGIGGFYKEVEQQE